MLFLPQVGPSPVRLIPDPIYFTSESPADVRLEVHLATRGYVRQLNNEIRRRHISEPLTALLDDMCVYIELEG